MNDAVELSPETIAVWQDRLSEAQADQDHNARYAAYDAKRVAVCQEMLNLLTAFLNGAADSQTLKQTFDKKTRKEWDCFGLKGFSGAMYLNILVNRLPDQERLTDELRAVLPVPVDAAAARTQLTRFIDYLVSLIDAGKLTNRQLPYGFTPFLVSAWWHVQQPDQWPIYYVTDRRQLSRDGLFVELGQDLVGEYLAFTQVYLALTAALGVGVWDVEHLIGRLSTVPPTGNGDDAHGADHGSAAEDDDEPAPSPQSAHVHMQWLLAKIGRRLGCLVWIASNDHNRTWEGQRLGDLSLPEMPHLALDSESQDVVALIDVVWLKGGKQIVGAFEVEHTTSVYSGLLRMADLVALAPNLAFPLYIVTPEARLPKVRRELSRPAFQALELHTRCGFFSEEELLAKAPQIMDWATDPSAIDKFAKHVGDE